MEAFFEIIGRLFCLIVFCIAIAKLAGILTIDIKRED